MRLRSYVVFAAIAALVVAGLSTFVATWGRADQGATAYVREHPVEVPASARTVAVSLEMPRPSTDARRLSAMLVEGRMPSTATMAEVLTDTECAPDTDMVSHCRNVMRLNDGTTIVVRHPHDMRDIPCLAPGEKVRLTPAA